MSYEDTLRRLGGTTAAQTAALLAAYRDGTIRTKRTLEAAIMDAITVAGQQGAALGELTLVAYVNSTEGGPMQAAPSPAIVKQGGNRHGLRKVVRQVLEDVADPHGDTEMRLDRLSFSEPVYRSQQAYGTALAADERVGGWTRGLDSKACELCQWWSRDGRVWPAVHPMPTHKGCCCQQVPYIGDRGDVPATEYSAKVSRTEAIKARRERDRT